MGAARRPGDRRPSRRGGAPVRRQGARGLPRALGDLRGLRGDRGGPGAGRLSRCPATTQGGHVNRADRVSERLGADQLDLLLVTNLVNVRYLTGFTGSNGLAIVGSDTRRFLTDFRYVEQAKRQVADFDREQAPQDFLTALGEGWPDGDLRVGFEADHVTEI